MSLLPVTPSTSSTLTIYWDDIQEGLWFQKLHPKLRGARTEPIEGAVVRNPLLGPVLRYDRPDVILADSNRPILVVERTVEVPSGHNVGQRYPRLAAAAQARVPLLHVVPYVARKHGGETEGPRYMNLRLFKSLDEMARIEKTAVVLINWPVDNDCEVIQTPTKDTRVVAFLDLYFDLYSKHGVPGLADHLMQSEFEATQLKERETFVKERVRRPEQYDQPPATVKIGKTTGFPDLAPLQARGLLRHEETVVYEIGMTYIRSDPYTGAAMLYEYLYAGGPNARTRDMVLSFPQISSDEWRDKVKNGRESKETRLYRITADAIRFADRLIARADLP